MNRLAAIAIATLIAITPLRASAQALVVNGNFWQSQSAASHTDYILGFIDGMRLGNNFSYWATDIHTKEGAARAESATSSYDTETKRYMSNVTVGQIVDGLNQFYSDFRNRNIMIHDAVWLVLEQIAGTPDSGLNIESWRKYSR